MTNKEAIRILQAIKENPSMSVYLPDEYEALDLAIKALDARPTDKWIPVSERLPERDEVVLVSYKTGSVHLCKYLDDGSENPWWSYIDDCCAWNNVVNAWMPMPEPYKKGEEE